MPGPFPGMDPYLEMQPFWSDFAPKFLTAISNEMLGRLVPRYDVRIEEYLMLTEDDFNLHRLRPDVTVSTPSPWKSSGPGALAVVEPATSELEYPAYEPRTEHQLRIVDRETNQTATVLKLLSPECKLLGRAGQVAHQRKRAELLACRCHIVELDLLRGGERLPMAGPLPPGDYYAFIGRVGRKPRCQVLGWPLRSALPTIAIPLLPEDPELALDLQGVFRAAYEPGLYNRRLPYDQPLNPPLRASDEPWVREALTQVQ